LKVLEDAPGNTFTSLSVVIIARNEAQNIARAIESVLCAVESWPRTEILLVDSASSDETVNIAKLYPINIVRLNSSWYLSAAAGRYIGTCHTQGDLILYLDGDMELDPEWVDQSVTFAIEHPQAAAIGGYWRDVQVTQSQTVGEKTWRRDPHGRVIEPMFLNGAMLCRRSAVLLAGGFQPFIKSEEEIDLCIRLRHLGYKIVRLPYLICRHYCTPEDTLAGTLRRLRLNMWLGYGQVPRYHLGTPLFWSYLKLRSTSVMYVLGMLVSLASLLISILIQNIIILGVWTICVMAFILILSIKKHSFRETLLSLLSHSLIAYSAVRGFMMVPRSSAEYPTDAEIVKVVHNLGGFNEAPAS